MKEAEKKMQQKEEKLVQFLLKFLIINCVKHGVSVVNKVVIS
jgi:hypothetical protein